jgi:hypothetical protein
MLPPPRPLPLQPQYSTTPVTRQGQRSVVAWVRRVSCQQRPVRSHSRWMPVSGGSSPAKNKRAATPLKGLLARRQTSLPGSNLPRKHGTWGQPVTPALGTLSGNRPNDMVKGCAGFEATSEASINASASKMGGWKTDPLPRVVGVVCARPRGVPERGEEHDRPHSAPRERAVARRPLPLWPLIGSLPRDLADWAATQKPRTGSGVTPM